MVYIPSMVVPTAHVKTVKTKQREWAGTSLVEEALDTSFPFFWIQPKVYINSLCFWQTIKSAASQCQAGLPLINALRILVLTQHALLSIVSYQILYNERSIGKIVKGHGHIEIITCLQST